MNKQAEVQQTTITKVQVEKVKNNYEHVFINRNSNFYDRNHDVECNSVSIHNRKNSTHVYAWQHDIDNLKNIKISSKTKSKANNGKGKVRTINISMKDKIGNEHFIEIICFD